MANPQRAADTRDRVDPRTQADPERKSERVDANLCAREVCERLRSEKGDAADAVPSERTMRDIRNRMGYRLTRIRKAKPLRKTASTDAIVANVAAVKAEATEGAETLEISTDPKAKVSEGGYARGGKNPDGVGRDVGERSRP